MAGFVPMQRMRDRIDRALADSDSAAFWELMLFGEFVLKMLVVEVLSMIEEDRDRHRAAIEAKLVRADSLGDWAQALDDIVQGPASQHLRAEGRDSQRAIATAFGPTDQAWQRKALDHLAAACEIVGVGTEGIAQSRGGLRQWTRLFVTLRNATRGHGATLPAVMARAAQEVFDSVTTIVDSAPAFSRPWAYLRRQLSGRMRATHIAGEEAPFRGLLAADVERLPDGVYLFAGDLVRANVLFTDPELLDFFLPNGAFRAGRFEVLSYITGSRQRHDAGPWQLDVQSLPISETAARPELDVVGEAFANLPPRRDGYVRRPRLEADLHELLCESRHTVLTLQGRGGVGKTSLALQVLHEVAKTGKFSVIVWFSARDIDLLPGGPKVVKPDVLTREEMARDFASLMGRELANREALGLMAGALSGAEASGLSYLFVFDNFETLRDPGDLYDFVSNSIRPPNKALITTRTRTFKGDYPVEVRGMEREEFIQLVESTATRLGIGNVVNAGFVTELYATTDAHPYVAKVILGEIAHQGKRLSVERAVANNERMLDALFERSFAALTPAAQRVFLTLCGWRSLVPRIGIEAAIRRPGNEEIDVDRAVDELIQTSLVEQLDDEVDFADAFLSVPLAASTFGRQKMVTSELHPAIEADLEILKGFGAVKSTEAKRGLAPRVERLTQELAKRSNERAFLDQGLAVMEYIANSWPPAWRNLSRLQSELSRPRDAIESQRRYLERHSDDSEAWAELLALLRAGRDLPAELNARLQYVEHANPPFEDLIEYADRLIYLLSRKDFAWDPDARKRSLERLREMLESRIAEASANDLSKVAWLCMHLQDLDGARKWVDLGLERDPSNPYCLSLLEKLNSPANRRPRRR